MIPWKQQPLILVIPDYFPKDSWSQQCPFGKNVVGSVTGIPSSSPVTCWRANPTPLSSSTNGTLGYLSGLFKLFLGSSLNSIISKPEIGWRRGNKKLWASGVRRCTSAIAMESPGGTQPHTHTWRQQCLGDGLWFSFAIITWRLLRKRGLSIMQNGSSEIQTKTRSLCSWSGPIWWKRWIFPCPDNQDVARDVIYEHVINEIAP